MTIFVVVAVFDSAAKGFARPAFVPSVGAAMRSFGDEVNRADKDNVMYQHPEDFSLYELGVYDDGFGSFTLLEQNKLLITGKSVRL